jgi:serine/threonine protein kinase
VSPAIPSAETLLTEAVGIPDPFARDEYLNRACANDDALRKQVGRLVANHFRAGHFLEQSPALPNPTETVAFDHSLVDLAPDTILGPYRLREKIGEGGMGVVYVAEQDIPVRRRVALKVIKPGMGSQQVVARFEVERQALALMDHPNIARVLDGGATPDGRPYFVMELVRGLPLTEYCEQAGLSTHDRLALFVNVCQAVQHAHQKGIIHRDLKPSNILVTMYDGRPVPKVIDFGVAKAIGPSLTTDNVYTAFAQMVGTPLYMSPEQAELSSADVDTRADVYSLGVVLYELLTGTTPFDTETLRKAGFDGMRQIIREQEPPRPSERLSTLDARAKSTLKGRRQVDDRRLSRQLRRELDWVVMKALEKDRNRRYESASALAADVERYLHNEPVVAIPPSASYRLQKFVRRNQGTVITATVILIAFVGGFGGLIWGLRESKKREDAAIQAEIIARIDKENAERAEMDARTFSTFLVNNFLAPSDPNRDITYALHNFMQVSRVELILNSPGEDIRMSQALERAEKQLPNLFLHNPGAEATARFAIGLAWAKLSRWENAIRHLARAAELRIAYPGVEQVDLREALTCLGQTLIAAGQLHEAIPHLEKVCAIVENEFGERYRTERGEYNLADLKAEYDLALALKKAGKLSDAIRHFERVNARQLVNVRPDRTLTFGSPEFSPDVVEELAFAYRAVGRPDDARRLWPETVANVRGRDGIPRHVIFNLHVAWVNDLIDNGLTAQALEVVREFVTATRAVSPANSVNFASENQLLGRVLLANHQPREAEQLLRESLSIQTKARPDASSTFVNQSLLGAALLAQKKYAEAEPLLVSGYIGMKQRQSQMAFRAKVRLREAADRLIELFTATNKPDEIAKWQAERAKYNLEVLPPPRRGN